MTAVGDNYISDGAIMAWLASQQDRVYGELKASMDIAERRADFTSKLVDIKAHLEEANGTSNFGAVDLELQAFMAEYGSDPEFAEICASLQPVATKIHQDWDYAANTYDKEYLKYQEDKATYDVHVAELENTPNLDLDESAIEWQKPTPPDLPVTSYSDEDLKTWTTLIDGKIDVSGKNDQLTMIHIQELKATIDQGSQLGSAWIAGGDKTIDRIIGNFS